MHKSIYYPMPPPRIDLTVHVKGTVLTDDHKD